MICCKDCKFDFGPHCRRDATFNEFTDMVENLLDKRTNTNGICKYFKPKKKKRGFFRRLIGI